jgi:hypothetical protein
VTATAAKAALFGLAFIALFSLNAAADCLPNHQDEDSLLGHWSWIQTMDFLGGYLTPESEGYTLDLIIRPNGTYTELRNGSPFREGSWCLKVCEHGADPDFCNDQVVLLLSSSCVQGMAACQNDYWFCPDPQCATTTVSFDRALQVQAFAMDAGIETYEWLGPVLLEQDRWGAVKARY